MRFTIKKSTIPQWSYEIIAKNFHNIALNVEAAIAYLQDRYGSAVQYRVDEEARKES